MAVTAAMVKELREKTGAGMMDCKKALGETNGEMEAAVDWLREKGIAKAAKKASRVAADGKVICLAEGARGVVLEVNTETDFTAKNENFVAFVESTAALALAQAPADLEALKALDYPGSGRTVEAELAHLVATIGENMNLRRYGKLEVAQGQVASYIHMGGKIGVLVGLESAAAGEGLEELGKKLAMHVAASNPAFLDRNSVDPDALEREKAVLTAQAEGTGKPAEIIEKMVMGRLSKYYAEVCLVEQPFVMDPDTTVKKAVAEAGKALGAEVKVTGFVRFALGEGVEKKQEDFAEEVAKQMGQ